MIDPVSKNLFDSTAIAGAVYRHQFPKNGPLQASQFFGDEEAAAARLTELGLEVVISGGDWSEEEVSIAVSDYFDMLVLEAERVPYVKAEHNRLLLERLRSRSKGSVELTHQNISSVFDDLGLPFIPGHKPQENAQDLLRQVVRRYIGENPQTQERVMIGLEQTPVVPPVTPDFVSALVTVPSTATVPSKTHPRVARKFDFASRDERNRSLGQQGERWVIEFERDRRKDAGSDRPAGSN